jgi:Skp family chaperone for outer membrane proteins
MSAAEAAAQKKALEEANAEWQKKQAEFLAKQQETQHQLSLTVRKLFKKILSLILRPWVSLKFSSFTGFSLTLCTALPSEERRTSLQLHQHEACAMAGELRKQSAHRP